VTQDPGFLFEGRSRASAGCFIITEPVAAAVLACQSYVEIALMPGWSFGLFYLKLSMEQHHRKILRQKVIQGNRASLRSGFARHV